MVYKHKEEQNRVLLVINDPCHNPTGFCMEDSDYDDLVDLLNGMLCHVNLIPINAIEDGKYRRPPQNVVMAFRDALNNRGVTATVRRELGNEIDAACGQLRRRFYEE